ncbi:MAG: SDR family oxidoreductase [Gemmatimonadota bacterium]
MAPGPVQTGWIDRELEEDLVEELPVRRVGTPEDAAAACLFLASPRAGWITGQALWSTAGTSCPEEAPGPVETATTDSRPPPPGGGGFGRRARQSDRRRPGKGRGRGRPGRGIRANESWRAHHDTKSAASPLGAAAAPISSVVPPAIPLRATPDTTSAASPSRAPRLPTPPALRYAPTRMIWSRRDPTETNRIGVPDSASSRSR